MNRRGLRTGFAIAIAIAMVMAVAIAGALSAVGYALLNRTDDSAGLAPTLAGAPLTASVVARGEYLARAAGCVTCHTVPDSGRPFAGGVAFKLPFGTLYSSNITADLVTGIGGWGDADFVSAVREGVGPGGGHLYPALPYTSYTLMARADLLAIKAYLLSLPPVRQRNRANPPAFPVSQRWAVGFWNAAFFTSRRFTGDPRKSVRWNRGAYLATALGHCAECHGEGLSGQELQGWRAYNITPEPRYGIGSWSEAEIAQYLKTGHVDGRASAAGPMGEVVATGLQFLDDADVAALVDYLKSLAPRAGGSPVEVDARPAPVARSSAAAPSDSHAPERESTEPDSGRDLFAGACASCHQWNGQGRESAYAGLVGTRGVNDSSGANVTQVILHGVRLRVAGHDIYMPAFGGAYTDAEVAALANYVIGHFGGKQSGITAADVAKRREL